MISSEGYALENDPIFSEVQLRIPVTDPLAPIGDLGAGAITQISGGSSGFGASVVGDLATLVSPLTTKGDLYTRSNTVGTRLPVGAPGEVLTADPGETTGLKWEAGATPSALSVVTITVADSPYALSDTDDIVRVDASGGVVNVSLHAVATAKQKRYSIKKIDASANAVNLNGNGGDTIDGAGTQSIVVQYQSLEIIPDNASEWGIY